MPYGFGQFGTSIICWTRWIGEIAINRRLLGIVLGLSVSVPLASAQAATVFHDDFGNNNLLNTGGALNWTSSPTPPTSASLVESDGWLMWTSGSNTTDTNIRQEASILPVGSIFAAQPQPIVVTMSGIEWTTAALGQGQFARLSYTMGTNDWDGMASGTALSMFGIELNLFPNHDDGQGHGAREILQAKIATKVNTSAGGDPLQGSGNGSVWTWSTFDFGAPSDVVFKVYQDKAELTLTFPTEIIETRTFTKLFNGRKVENGVDTGANAFNIPPAAADWNLNGANGTADFGLRFSVNTANKAGQTIGLDSFSIEIPDPSGPNGDYNLDGTVDAADYVLWRMGPDSFGGPGGYSVWRANFGLPASSGAAGSSAGAGPAAIPEPASSLLALSGLAYIVVRRNVNREHNGSRPE